MFDREQQHVNFVEAYGRLVSERNTPAGKIITIFSHSGREIYPKFYCPKGVMLALMPHSEIHVKGHIELRRRPGEIPRQVFVADEIERPMTLTEEIFGEPGRFFPRPSSVVYLKGTLVSAKIEGDWHRYVIQTETSKGRTVPVRVSMRKLEKDPDYKKGDSLCCVCVITTRIKEVSGQKRYFEDILVSDIAKIED